MFGNTLLIVNPQAQSGRARHAREEIAHLLESITNVTQGHYFEVIETTHPLDAVIITHELGENFDTIFALGGDGLVHEVVNGLMQIEKEKRPTLGIFPAGQGNDFARSLNLHTAGKALTAGKHDAADRVVTHMLGNLHHIPPSVHGKRKGFSDFRQNAGLELYVDDRAGDLYDLTCIHVVHASFLCF